MTAVAKSLYPLNGASKRPIVEEIDWEAIVTEDDTPVDNFTTEKHGGLLTDTLYDSFVHPVHGKRFIVAAGVGIFYAPHEPPIIPDIFLSLGLNKPQDRKLKRNRSYFVWEVGKVPEVVIKIVSNQEGEEEGAKKQKYCDQEGRVIPTGRERAEQEHQRAERLAAQLRALGIEPDENEGASA